MSEALLNGGYDKNVYGAVSFREADSDNGVFDYTVHVRLGGVVVVALAMHMLLLLLVVVVVVFCSSNHVLTSNVAMIALQQWLDA